MLPADPRTLGATLTDGGCNFALWSNAATAVELCLFNEVNGKLVETRFALSHRNGPIWHGYLAGVRAGQRYGYRVYGTWAPEYGSRFNAAKLLIDPYAHKLDGELNYSAEIYGHVASDGTGAGDTTVRDDRDSAGHVPYSVVTDYRTREINRPIYSWTQEVIYEAHVQGLTAKNHEIPKSERGTYKALGHPSTIAHLKEIGITALELLPIHSYVTEPGIWDRGRKNHWGYNAIAFSAPHAQYAATDDPTTELQEAVDRLHDAGIEVFLDVVYNHTGEGGVGGPTLSFKGIDNNAWYRHDHNGNYVDVTGCGNTVAASKPHGVRHIIDSLRWWVEVVGVDGFRFDLATALYATSSASDSALMSAIESDSVLRNFKMIAEPWDISRYSLGDFPHPWREWNDRYRDSVRQFWLGDLARGYGEGVADVAAGISGSSDIFYYRGPTSSINFVTAHDGFTLSDLTMYSNKRNEANQEDNRDGSNENRSWNMGVEGPSEDPSIQALRLTLKKSMMATLMLSAGVPMINMGDEICRTQDGSNNGYSMPKDMWPGIEDSPETFGGGWANSWNLSPEEQDMKDAVGELARIRKTYLADVAAEFFTGRVDLGTQRKDIAWFSLGGHEMTEEHWADGEKRSLSVLIEAGPHRGLLLLLNSSREETLFTLPDEKWGTSFRRIFDAASPVLTHEPVISLPTQKVSVAPHCAHVWLVTRS
ncbi:PulA Type II secretory pathway, pullulanase PulA and related glycosidases [Candidatus Nanopelagicaceae bacterium]